MKSSHPQCRARAPWSAILTAGLSLAVANGCGGAGGPQPDDDGAASGFAPEDDDDEASSTDDGSSSGAEDASGTEGQPLPDDLGNGDLRGILTFTFYAPDTLSRDPALGMAGAWRTRSDDWGGWDAIDDFYAVYGLETLYPSTPSEPDRVESSAEVGAFDWGAPSDWLLAGTSMKLQAGELEAHACLFYLGGSPEVVYPPGPTGETFPNYPMYAANASSNQPEGCAPTPDVWRADTTYDLVLYGGELFETNSLADRVRTPAALEVTAPPLDRFGVQLDSTSALELRWETGESEDDRLVIRLWDSQDVMLSVLAEDDGEYDIPASELSVLTPGPVTMTIARERLHDIPFTDGRVKVATRFEAWGYFDLY